MDGQTVKIKYEILNKTKDIYASNPQSASKDYKELEKYLFAVVGTLDID
ncbi:MAG: hypothetical protein IPL10_10640 [Bacteroidetes bacterium]|nr:hypothetical protein [Bacteroidota bacterium]